MVPKRHPAVVAMAKITYVAIALLLPIVGATALVFSLSRDASAQGPCGTPHDAMDSEEFAFLAELQAWRDSHLQYPAIATTLLTHLTLWLCGQEKTTTSPL